MANAFQVGVGSSSGGVTSPGGCAIFGDNPIPYACALLGASTSDFLTTGDLSPGEAGDMGGLDNFAIELWFQTTSIPAGDLTFARGPLDASASTQWGITLKGSTGTISVFADDDTGTTRTANGVTSLVVGNWYHIVATAQGGNLIVYVNGVSDGSTAAWGSHRARAMGTTAGSIDMRLVGPNVGATNFFFDVVATYRTGLTSTRVLEHYNAGVNRGWKAQGAGQRMLAAMDACGHRSPRNIQTGARSVVPRYMSGQSPLSEMKLALEADDVDAQLFCSRSGAVTFLQDGHRSSSPYSTVQAVFGNAGGSELPYLDLQVSYDVGQVVNQWNVTRTPYQQNTPVTQTASDTTSQNRNFIRPQGISDVPCLQDSDASTIATELLAKYKDPFYSIVSLKPNMADAATASAVYALDLCDRVEVKWTPPGGGSRIDQIVFIQKIEHSQSPGMPSDTTLTVTPF